jgi:crotonobetainyl-CoA:carnitine CoA-transferase CaiB-like acyl-CoA transferase
MGSIFMQFGGGNECSGLARFAAEVIRIAKPDRGDPFRSFSKNIMRPQICAYKGGKSITDDLNKSPTAASFRSVWSIGRTFWAI